MKLSTEQQTKLRELIGRTFKKNGQPDAEMIDYCLKSSKYIVIDDMFVCVGKSKPTIQKTLWYDDTQKSPESNFDAFVYANRYNMPRELELIHRCDDLRYLPQYFGDCENLFSLTHNIDESLRKVTPEELKIINAAINEVKADYQKRLETYYKKYSKNFSVSGYWVDR
jgi:hypothetical protein